MPFSAAAIASNDYLTGRQQCVQGSDNSVLAQRFTTTLLLADLAAAQVGALGILPAGHVPTMVEIDAAQLDSNGAPTLTYSLGVMNPLATAISVLPADGGAAWATGLTIGRTAGGSASGPIPSRPLKLVTQTQVDRQIGIQITGAAATAVSGSIAVTVHYRPGPA